MNIVFLSNYFSHHQKPLSDALAKRCRYSFIATAEMTRERRAMGWGYDAEPEYVCSYASEPERAEELLAHADVVIAGSAPEPLVRGCIRRGQPVFRYSERPLKNGAEPLKYLPRLVKWHLRNPVGKPVYLLCASAYTAGDYARFGLFRNRAFRWGYFPEVKGYENITNVMHSKRKASILWVGRFLDWKHPEDAVAVAAALKAAGCSFEMNMIGSGPMEQTLREMIAREQLEDDVHLLGTMRPEEVRGNMEKAEIFLFTSDRREGWGAVLNEAMNSGCAVVASDAAGSVPYLVRNAENGLVYHCGDIEDLTEKVKRLLADPGLTQRLGLQAYSSMRELWNAEVAAQRLMSLAQSLLAGERDPDLYPEGPCSKEQAH